MKMSDLRRHREAVVAFHNAYGAYLDAGPQGDPELRAKVVELIPAAQTGMIAAGVDPVMYPPRLVGGPVMQGIANIAFQHEKFGAYESMPGELLDACRLAGATLDERIELVRRRRRNPFYWLDRLLRAILGVPAYLISLIFRVPYQRVDASAVLGPILRAISAAGAIAAIYFGGRDAGWW